MEGVVEAFHIGVALLVAQCQDVLQRDSDVREEFFDIAAPVIFLCQALFAVKIVGERPTALLQCQFDFL